jgi:hypothetical protein
LPGPDDAVLAGKARDLMRGFDTYVAAGKKGPKPMDLDRAVQWSVHDIAAMRTRGLISPDAAEFFGVAPDGSIIPIAERKAS